MQWLSSTGCFLVRTERDLSAMRRCLFCVYSLSFSQIGNLLLYSSACMQPQLFLSCSLCMFVGVFLCLPKPRRWACICGWISACGSSPPVCRAAQSNRCLWLNSEDHSSVQQTASSPLAHLWGRIPLQNNEFVPSAPWLESIYLLSVRGLWKSQQAWLLKPLSKDNSILGEKSLFSSRWILFSWNVSCGGARTILHSSAFETGAGKGRSARCIATLAEAETPSVTRQGGQRPHGLKGIS